MALSQIVPGGVEPISFHDAKEIVEVGPIDRPDGIVLKCCQAPVEGGDPISFRSRPGLGDESLDGRGDPPIGLRLEPILAGGREVWLQAEKAAKDVLSHMFSYVCVPKSFEILVDRF